jgi:D-alanyl-D-alanine carboxypeptidase
MLNNPRSARIALNSRVVLHYALTVLWPALVVLSTTSPVARADVTDHYVRAEMANRKIPGLSVAVIRDGRVVKEAAYGRASIELGVPASLDTSYPLASMTKNFTAAAIMLLVEEGRLSLDEPVIKILPQLPGKWGTVTIRHCLSHTSGLPDALIDGINVTTVNGDRNALLQDLAKMPIEAAGERSVYNQTGYVLLGMVIERTAGMSYEQFVESRLFKPAGVTGARFGDAWVIMPGRTDFYTALEVTPDHLKFLVRDGNPVFLHDRILHYGAKFMPDYMAPAGLLNGSIRDLVKWEMALSDGKIVKASSLREMTTPYRLREGKDGAFGLGFVTGSIGPYATVSYGGGAAAWRLGIPVKHLTVIVLTNLQGSGPDTLAAGIAALYEPTVATRPAH